MRLVMTTVLASVMGGCLGPSFVNRTGRLAALLALIATVCLQELHADEVYTPQVGQAGKDVIWVPAPLDVVNLMLDIAGVTSSDVVLDLGSGDGRIPVLAARRGARAVGIEYNPDLVALSKRLAAREGVSDRTTFIRGDLFSADLSQATVITMYLLPAINDSLMPKLLALKPGTRIVSHSFSMSEWPPQRVETIDKRRVYFWRVGSKCPTRVRLEKADGPIKFDLMTYITSQGGVVRAEANVKQRLTERRRNSPGDNAQLRSLEHLVKVLEACH